ncbi:hypothetical protein L6R50_06095 [Myxococcota bacterium]|nr:hypothetical protein [Myxococcota bacterium]
MRRRLPASLIALVPFLAFAAPAASAPSLEEQALREALSGRPAAAVRLLEGGASDDPLLRWVAGRVALRAGDHATARRLLGGDDPASAWGRVDLLLATGGAGEAAALSLGEMDRALSGEHREALGRMLIDWATERRTRDPADAARLLEAVLGLETSPELRRAAEDALFGVTGEIPSAIAYAAARTRLSADGGDLAARRVVGLHLGAAAPARALALLSPVAEGAPRDEALSAVRAAVALDVPAPLRLRLSRVVGERFPEDLEIARFRLDFAKSLSGTDPALASPALLAMGGHPRLGGEAMEAWATCATGPGEARARWRKVAEGEGASARGEAARRAAEEALLAGVRAAPEGEARVRAAERALAEPDGAGDPELTFLALGPVPADEAGARRWAGAVLDLAGRFPVGGPWCDPLAEALVAVGAEPDAVERFLSTCPHARSSEASALREAREESPGLRLTVRDGGVLALATGTKVLRVAQHAVDPETLLRAAEGNPLDVALDAFLVEPDAEWEVPVPEGKLARVRIAPRGGAALVALTVRAGDLRATALVPPEPLRVEAVRRGGEVAVAAFRGSDAVGGAQVNVRDGTGAVRALKADPAGVARGKGLEGSLTVMARSGRGLGFATLPAGPVSPEEAEVTRLVPHDREAPAEGGPGRVQVFVATDAGAGGGRVTIRSYTRGGEALDSAEVALASGSATAEIWLQGGGRVAAERAGREVASLPLGVAPEGPGPGVAVSFLPARPRLAGSLGVEVHPTLPASPDGRSAWVRVTTPWSETVVEEVIEGGVVRVPVDLAAAAPGDRVAVEARIGGAPMVSAEVRVQAGDPPAPPRVPPVAAVDERIAAAPEGCWLRAVLPASGNQIWVGGEPLALPREGEWAVSAWCDGAESQRRTVRAVAAGGKLGADGRWSGAEPTLWAESGSAGIRAAGVLRPGEGPPRSAEEGAVDGHSVLAGAPDLAISAPGAPERVLALAGAPRRGESRPLAVGAGMPEGSRLWVFVRDASDGAAPSWAHAVRLVRRALPGLAQSAWVYPEVSGETIAAALLAEEERLAEQREPEMLDWDRAAAEESAMGMVGSGSAGGSGFGGLGTRGSGRGGGGMARDVGLAGLRPGHDPRALAFFGAARPGELPFTAPPWVTEVSVEAVALTPDGRWHTGEAVLAVEGAPPSPRPSEPVPAVPSSWDGTLAVLRAVASGLPVDARRQALAGLVAAGDAGATPSLRAALAHAAGRGAGAAVAARLGHAVSPDAAAALRRLEGLPDVRHVERAMAALEAAPGQPERAVAAARRLLREEKVEPWVRSRAALALWVGGQPEEAREVLAGDDVPVVAARAVVAGELSRDHAPALWAVARDEAAAPDERALCLQALALIPGAAVRPVERVEGSAVLPLRVGPPLASFRGETFPRGRRAASKTGGAAELDAVDRVPLGRTFPVAVTVPESSLPGRLGCPDGGGVEAATRWIDLSPSPIPRDVECSVRAVAEGAVTLAASWHGPGGEVRASGRAALEVEAARPGDPQDPMSPDERLELGIALAQAGLPGGRPLLAELLAADWISPRAVAAASAALLEEARRGDDPRALVAAFEAHRERSPDADLDLALAAAVARAYAAAGEPARAVAAARVVLDARFREELAAVREVQEGGLTLTALKLLRELMRRYPEVPTVVEARYLVPSMLLGRASGDGDRLGLTRSSLRHTSAAELARFLLVHPKATASPEAAVLLMDTLRQLGDAGRQQALAGPLATAFRDAEVAWRLALADARARFARGRAGEARAVLLRADPKGEGAAAVALELGRVYEAEGDRRRALEHYRRAGGHGDADARIAWLERDALEVEPFRVLRPGEPAVLPGALRPGSKVALTAYRIALESLFLRDGGSLDPEAVRVDGLRPAALGEVAVDARGDVPLPALGDGAYLLTVGIGATTHRAVLVRSDLEVSTRPGSSGDLLIQLSDGAGRPVRDALVWSFDDGGSSASRTDPLGAVHLAGGASMVLARAGDRYASQRGSDVARSPAQAIDFEDQPVAGELLDLVQQNNAAYEGLFRQERKAKVRADGL